MGVGGSLITRVSGAGHAFWVTLGLMRPIHKQSHDKQQALQFYRFSFQWGTPGTLGIRKAKWTEFRLHNRSPISLKRLDVIRTFFFLLGNWLQMLRKTKAVILLMFLESWSHLRLLLATPAELGSLWLLNGFPGWDAAADSTPGDGPWPSRLGHA